MLNKKNTKNFVLLLGLTAMMLLPTNLNAQYDGSRGLFVRGETADNVAYSTRDGLLNINSNTDGGISNDDFNETPLGSGIAILIGAGLGYMALKKKEDKQ